MKNDYIYLGRFVWNTKKAKNNVVKHHVSFETAARIFNDPVLYVEYDEEHSTSEEERYHCVGYADKLYAALSVIITEQEPYIRIISARKATRKEVSAYEKNAKNLRDD